MAFRINKEFLADRALLPHVLCKNCVVELNFGQKEEPFFPPPQEFVFIHAVPVEERVRTAVPPKTIEECEVCSTVCRGLSAHAVERWGWGGVAFLLTVLTWGKGGRVLLKWAFTHQPCLFFMAFLVLFAGDSDGGTARIWKDSVGTEILKRKP